MSVLLTLVFLVGYIAITLEHGIKLNKAASALLLGGICWTIFILGSPDPHVVLHQLEEQTGEVSGILFFLLGAMTIVELIDAHDGFEVITSRLTTRNATRLLLIIAFLTFFLSAVLDNLTTTIVMVSLLRKLVSDPKIRLQYIGLVIIAANAGGAWSPIGDVSTTMLWIGGQVTTGSVVRSLFLPSIVCLLVPMLIIMFRYRGKSLAAVDVVRSGTSTGKERNIIFISGICILVLVPVFKAVTHLPPYIGMLIGLGLLWVISELIHKDKDDSERKPFSVAQALGKIDTPSVLFFLGILLAVGAMGAAGILTDAAQWLDGSVGNMIVILLLIGLLSAILDNVPLVAAVIGMYSLQQYPQDDFFWTFLAYCAGTGGSTLIIGSAAGVAAMGMEKIGFFWYLRNVSWLALAGYFAGAGVFLIFS